MGSSLATIRTRLRHLLDDAGATIWSDAELQSHIEAALKDLSPWIPRQRTATLSTTANNRAISVSSVTDAISLRALEHPTGEDPKRMRQFSLWATTLTVEDDPKPDGTNATLYYDAYHVINGTSSLDIAHDETLVFGAAWLACQQQAADTTNAINDAGAVAPRDWDALARRHHADYVARRNPQKGIRRRRLYRPADATATIETDPGP